MTNIVLYGHWVSQPTRAVGWFCMLAGIDFTFKQINVMQGEHKTPEFLKISPNGLIPAIHDISEDIRISESNAILQYLSEKLGNSSWFPQELKIRAAILQYLHWHHSNTRLCSSSLFRPVMIAMVQKQSPNTNRGMKKVLPVLEKLNRWLAHSDYLCYSNQPTIADIACYCEIDQLKVFQLLDFSSFPHLSRWISAMESLPFHKESHEGLESFYSFLLKRQSKL